MFAQYPFQEGGNLYGNREQTRRKHDFEIKLAVLNYTSHNISRPHFHVYIYIITAAFQIPPYHILSDDIAPYHLKRSCYKYQNKSYSGIISV